MELGDAYRAAMGCKIFLTVHSSHFWPAQQTLCGSSPEAFDQTLKRPTVNEKRDLLIVKKRFGNLSDRYWQSMFSATENNVFEHSEASVNRLVAARMVCTPVRWR